MSPALPFHPVILWCGTFMHCPLNVERTMSSKSFHHLKFYNFKLPYNFTCCCALLLVLFQYTSVPPLLRFIAFTISLTFSHPTPTQASYVYAFSPLFYPITLSNLRLTLPSSIYTSCLPSWGTSTTCYLCILEAQLGTILQSGANYYHSVDCSGRMVTGSAALFFKG